MAFGTEWVQSEFVDHFRFTFRPLSWELEDNIQLIIFIMLEHCFHCPRLY